VLPFKLRCRNKSLASQHKILATGCIQSPPKASNLFREEAYRVAFGFALVVELCLLAPDFFFAVVDEPFALAPVLFPLLRTEPLLTEPLAACALLFRRDALPRTRIPGASFTGSTTASDAPGRTTLEDR
jgi:hypothetical protein